MIEQITSLLAPHECLGCKKEGSLICKACQDAFPAPPAYCFKCGHVGCTACPSLLKDVFAATIYKGLAKELIHKLKFERAHAAAESTALLIAQRLPLTTGDDTVIAFVPTAAARIRVRGYDQAAAIAHRVAAIRGIPCLSLLYRHGRQRQVGQSKTVRLRQLQGAFSVNKQRMPHNKRILLIDDVLTTGATLEAGARALHEAGAKHIDGVVFAAAERFGAT
jgi:ComF family protein